MDSSPLTLVGRYVIGFADLIQIGAWYIYGAIIVAILGLLLLRLITDALQLSPFGRFAYYARRPANELLHNMRNSRFYLPLKRALGFDPAILMLLIATAILCYVTSGVIEYFATLLKGLGNTFLAFGAGEPFTGGRYLIGTLLLAVIFYLLVLMTFVFVYWMFGLLGRVSHWALERIGPLLRVFDFGGAFTGWSFLILWIALVFAAAAIQLIFLR